MRYTLFPASCLLFLTLMVGVSCQGQVPYGEKHKMVFTRADTLRGMLGPERSCYDVTYYRLAIQVDPGRRFVQGAVDIHFRAMSDFEWLQIDLFENMEIESILYEGETLDFTREQNAVFIRFPPIKSDHKGFFQVRYQGHPREAPDPPWEGGFVWSKDRLGRPWVGVACQGVGASLWWPNKDHLSDEPDSMDILLTVPDSLMGVANGKLIEEVENGAWTQYHWKVSYPINNYGVSVNVGHYAHLKDTYTSLEEKDLDLDYYVLFHNRRRARPHLEQAKEVLRCYETYFGAYPFWEDGFALIETPYLGMEHQSGIAYGNKFMRGYLGGMIPPNMDWDYVIVHETAHEYFGNAVSAEDMAEIWLHESFATYLESLFVEYKFGKQEALKYLKGQRSFLENRRPLLGPKNVNWDDWSAPDNYYKGALMLNSLRHEIGSDTLWFSLLRGFYEAYRYQTITTDDFTAWVSAKTGREYRPFLNQYLLYAELPVLEYMLLEKQDGLVFKARFDSDEPGFSGRVFLTVGEEQVSLGVNARWQEFFLKEGTLQNLRIEEEKGLFVTQHP